MVDAGSRLKVVGMDEKRSPFIEQSRRPSNTSEYDVNTNTSEGSNIDNEGGFDYKAFERLAMENNLTALTENLARFGLVDLGLLQNLTAPPSNQNTLMRLVEEHLPPQQRNMDVNRSQQSCCSYGMPPNHQGLRRSVIGSSSDESVLAPSQSISGESQGTGSRPSSRLIPAYVWTGDLPQRNYANPMFSCKLFVGGVPWDITEEALVEAFTPYGNCRVEWPGGAHRRPPQHRNASVRKANGYVYIVYEQDRSVKALLHDCNALGSAGEWFFKIKAKRNQTVEIRQVQIIPWVISDSNFVFDSSCKLDIKKTVFVGALHGMITAPILFNIMEELYGNVVFVGIDTDKHKYPIGSARVTFSNHNSYFRAIESAFLEVRTSKFSKRVQIDPFLEDSQCMVCTVSHGPLFCRDRSCFRYFCSNCWDTFHLPRPDLRSHRPLIRSTPKTTRREDFSSATNLRNLDDFTDQDVNFSSSFQPYRQTSLNSPVLNPTLEQTFLDFPQGGSLPRGGRSINNNIPSMNRPFF